MRRIPSFAILFALTISLSFSTLAKASPTVLSHHGRLLSASDQPVNGTHELTFSLYSAASGGAPLWEETWEVGFVDGFYSVLLGSDEENPDGSGTLDPALFKQSLFLSVRVGNGPELQPRQRLVAAPYAMFAAQAESIGAGAVIDGAVISGATITGSSIQMGDHVIIDSSGNWVAPPEALPYMTRDEVVSLEGDQSIDGVLTAQRFISTESLLPPFEVNSGALVPNLNAERLDGRKAEDFVERSELAHTSFRNHVRNSSFEAPLEPDSPPQSWQSSNVVFAPSTGLYDQTSLFFSTSGNGSLWQDVLKSAQANALAGRTFSASIWARRVSGEGAANLCLSSGPTETEQSCVSISESQSGGSSAWVRTTLSHTINENPTNLSFNISTDAEAAQWEFDGALVNEGPLAFGWIPHLFEQLGSAGIDGGTLEDGSVDSLALADGSVTTQKLADRAVSGEKIGLGAVGPDQIEPGAVGRAQLAAGAVDGTVLDLNAVDTAHLEDGAVTSLKLALGAVDRLHLSEGSVDGDVIAAGSITGSHIASATITADKLAPGASGTDSIADGSITFEKLAAGAVRGDRIPSGGIKATHLDAGSVTTSALADESVTSVKIGSAQVGADHLAANSVTNAKIATGAVGTPEIQDDSISSAKLKDLHVTRAKIDDLAINSGKLANSAVTEAKLASNAVSTAKIDDGAVTAFKIRSRTITADRIALQAVGEQELADGAVVSSKLGLGAVDETKLANQSVSSDKIKDGAVTSSKFGSASVSSDHIQPAAVTTAKLADSAVNAGKLADSAVTGIKIASGAVSTAKIGDNQITAAKIADGAVSANKIDSGAVTTAKIVDGAVDNNKLANNAVTGAKIKNSTITGAKLVNSTIENVHLSDDSVSTSKLQPLSVTGPKLALDSVENKHLRANAVDTENIVSGAVSGDKLANNAVSSGKLASDANSLEKVSGGLLVNSTSRLGVGTNAPVARLHLSSNSANTDEVLRVESARYSGVEIRGDRNNASGEPGGAYLKFHVDTELTTGLIGLNQASGSTPDGGDSILGVPANSLLVSGNNRVVLGSAGHVGLTVLNDQVGLGTVSPAFRLHLESKEPDVDEIITVSSQRFAGLRLIADSANLSGEPGGAYVTFSVDGQTSQNADYRFLGVLQEPGTDPLGREFEDTLQNAILMGSTVSTHPVQIGSGAKARITVLGNGRVGIGTNAPASELHVAGTIRHQGLVATSDARLKRVDGDYERGLGDVLKIKTRRFHYLEKGPIKLQTDTEHQGVLAQELLEAIPEAVELGDDGYYSVRTDTVLWTLVNAVQQQQAMISSQDELIASQAAALEQAQTERENLEQRLERLERALNLGR